MKIKKILAGILAAAITVTSVSLPGFAENITVPPTENAPEIVEREPETVEAVKETSGDYEYTLRWNGTIEITKYKGSTADVVIPAEIDGKAVQSIGKSAFDSCRSLKSVVIPDSVTYIREFAFYCCIYLKSVAISNSVVSIGNSAFYGCEALTSVTIPNSVTSIDDYAFGNCGSLVSVTIPNSVTSIAYFAFIYCKSLKSVFIPESVTFIGGKAFGHCPSLTEINVSENNQHYKSINGVLFDKSGETIILYPIGKTGKYIIPDGVTSIDRNAFSGCVSLTSVTIPDSVTSIGFGAFKNCTSLTSIIIPDGVTSIYGSAFENCTSLTSVNIPDNVTSIGMRLFEGCTSLTSITIPDSVTSIGDSAFYGCTSLTSINIPDSVTSVGGYAFNSTAILNSQTSDLKYIGKWLIVADNDITTANIKSGTVGIAGEAFLGCAKLTSVVIPNGVKAIGTSAFDECFSLESVNIPDSVAIIEDSVFARCSSLTSVNLPSSITPGIGGWAFFDCTSLKSIIIPKSLIYINEETFGYYYDTESGEKLKDPDFKIYCYKGTAGEQYAIDYGFEYEIIGLKAVDALTATPTSTTQVKFNWSKVPGANGYYIDRLVDGKWKNQASIRSGDTLTATVGKLSANATYKFRVAAYKTVNGKNIAGNWKEISATTKVAATSTLTATPTSTTQIKFTWAKVPGANGYYIDRLVGGKWVNQACIRSGSTLTATVGKLSANTTYKFRVAAYKTVGGKNVAGAWKEISGTTKVAATTSLTASPTSSTKVKFTWAKVPGANGYYIDRLVGGKWVNQACVRSGSTLTATVGKLSANTTYKFRVAAYKTVNGKNVAGTWKEISATTKLGAVGSLKATPTSTTQVKFTWSKVSGANGYYIDRYINGKWVNQASVRSGSTLNATVGKLAKNTEYKFRVAAYKTVNGKNVAGTWKEITAKTKS